jgi:hypothetical protein
MANKCGGCRFYSGSNCNATGQRHGTNDSACGKFADHTGEDIQRKCGWCRFFDGKNCEETGSHHNSLDSACGKFVAFK